MSDPYQQSWLLKRSMVDLEIRYFSIVSFFLFCFFFWGGGLKGGGGLNIYCINHNGFDFYIN